jgi:superfamily II DNA or RNA helicase
VGIPFALHPQMEISYDRGTLLLSGAPENWASQNIAGVLWDHRVDSYRAPARLYSKIKKNLQNAGTPFTDRIDIMPEGPKLPRGISAAKFQNKPTEKWRVPELRPYQATALELWENAGGLGIVVLPTGAGKTITAIAAASSSTEHGLYRTLCLVPTKALLNQWQVQLKKYYSGPVGVYGDGSKTLEAITISTYESAYRYVAEFGNRFDLIIVDECHHFGVGMRDEILEMTTAPRRLGLTATPPSNPDASSRLIELIGPVVFELTMGDLSGTYLSDYDYFRLKVDLNHSERARYETEMSVYRKVYFEFRETLSGGTYGDWIRYASRTEEGRRALSSFREAKKMLGYCEAKARAIDGLLKRHWTQKTLIFTADTESAYETSRQHLVMPITSEITRKEREDMILRFRQGIIRTLVSCRVLNEGIDVPDAEVAIILGGNHGAREHIQRIGRTLRPVPGKRAQIYELICRNTIEAKQSARRGEAF